MPALDDMQRSLRLAVVTGDHSEVVPLIAGGRNMEKRLAIHHRHYEASLVRALLDKFPATAWLVGSRMVIEAAGLFVRQHPPKAPCISEYGSVFPQFLATSPCTDHVPYLRDFCELEWHVGQASIAVDHPSIALADLPAAIEGELMDAGLTLQSGVRYLHASWPVDDLLKLYLTETAPNQFRLEPADAWIEVRGARGEFQFDRLEAAEFSFREAILGKQTIGDAADRALEVDAGFEPGRALVSLFGAGLVTAIVPPTSVRTVPL